MRVGVVMNEVTDHRLHDARGDLRPSGSVEVGDGLVTVPASHAGSGSGSMRSRVALGRFQAWSWGSLQLRARPRVATMARTSRPMVVCCTAGPPGWFSMHEVIPREAGQQ